jgi:hypothetical protein
MQCMMGAMTAGAGVTGTRAWLATRHYSWITPHGMRVATFALIGAGLIGSAVGFHGA